jgi:type IV secretion system protein TrbL
MSAALGLGEAAESGRQAGFNAMARGTGTSAEKADGEATSMPGWARAMQNRNAVRHHGQAVVHAVSQGSSGGAGATPDIKERED